MYQSHCEERSNPTNTSTQVEHLSAIAWSLAMTKK